MGVKSVMGGGGRGTRIDLNSIYAYKVESFASFGTITCTAENDIGQSGPCMYNIVAAGKFNRILWSDMYLDLFKYS